MSSSGSPANGVPQRASNWISSYLATADPTASTRACLVLTHGLNVLQVKDLKKLINRINELVIGAVNRGDGSTTTFSTYRFQKPRSNARKADLIACLMRCFYTNANGTVPAPSNDAIWSLLGVQSSGAGNSAAAATRPAAPPVAAPASGRAAGPMPSMYGISMPQPAAAAAAAAAAYPYGSYMPPPHMAGGPGFMTGGYGYASAASAVAPGQTFGMPQNVPPQPVRPPAARKPSPPKGKKRPAPKPIEPDYVDMTLPPNQWGPPRTSGALREAVRIKKEKHAARSSSSLSMSSSSATAAAASSGQGGNDNGGGEDYYENRPRDMREMGLVGQMRAMGFTDQREILAGLRHVERQRAGGGGCMMLDSATHVEEAMMWIVSQREEADEARKMDLARITSEYDHSEEERRKKDADQRLQDAPLEDIVGVEESNDADGGTHVRHRSKSFHFSILLHSPMVRSIFLSISCPNAKKELIRLLKLEQKASQWYGSVLPWAYFSYVARERIENWADGEPDSKPSSDASDDKAQNIEALIHDEANALERALFVLSEQVDNGLQNVPKIFIKAREDANKKGLPDGPEGQATGDKSNDSDDDVIVVAENMSGAAKKDSTDERKPAAAAAAGSAHGSSSSTPRRNCSSSSSSARKKTPKTPEVIEIM